jgi:zinc D-Ala-D-Ala dipeptidase
MNTAVVLLFALHVAVGDVLPPPPRTPIGRMVNAKSFVPSLQVDLRYTTADNFLKRAVYPKYAVCLLTPEAAVKLERVAKELEAQTLRLKVYDCYRPLSVQWEMWKILPKPGYVADPRKGGNHNRGIAVDLTLTDAGGRELEMPTPFDTFSPAAHHGYDGGTPASRKNRETLLAAMEKHGFKRNAMEWWHYDLVIHTGNYPALDEPFPKPAGTD